MNICAIDGGYGSYDFEEQLFGKENFTVLPPNASMQTKIKMAQLAEGLLVRGTRIDEAFLAQVPSLRAIVRYGVGYDNIDLNACSRRGIKVANVQGYANHSVSDHAIALMYACLRSLPLAGHTMRDNFSNPPRIETYEFHSKTIGIVGLGRIGGTLCQKVKSLFDQVMACDPYIDRQQFEQLGAKPVSFQTLLRESFVITIHCNLTNETRQMFNREAFGLMGQRPILINTARGAIVDEKALLNALNQNRVHSAGLDVFQNEPPTAEQNELLRHKHVLATGHYAWYSAGASKELQQRAAHNLFNLLQGKTVEDCLNP